jgi:hypothetical protein
MRRPRPVRTTGPIDGNRSAGGPVGRRASCRAVLRRGGPSARWAAPSTSRRLQLAGTSGLQPTRNPTGCWHRSRTSAQGPISRACSCRVQDVSARRRRPRPPGGPGSDTGTAVIEEAGMDVAVLGMGQMAWRSAPSGTTPTALLTPTSGSPVCSAPSTLTHGKNTRAPMAAASAGALSRARPRRSRQGVSGQCDILEGENV